MGDIIKFGGERKPFDPTNYKVVKEIVKKLWDKGLTRFTYHARKRMAEKNRETTDIQYIIYYGTIVEHSHPGDFWRFKLEGKTVDDDLLACVVEIENKLVIITIID